MKEQFYEKVKIPVKYRDVFIDLGMGVVCVILGMLKGREFILSLIHI